MHLVDSLIASFIITILTFIWHRFEKKRHKSERTQADRIEETQIRIEAKIDQLLTKPMNIEWIPSPNHFAGRLGETARIICIHHTAASLDSAISHFQDAGSQVSTQYLVSSNGNRVVQMVQEGDAAWSCRGGNLFTINIECEDYDGVPFNGYNKVAELVREIATRNNIKIGTYTVLPHYAYVNTQCPAGVDVYRIMQMASNPAQNAPQPTVMQQLTATPTIDIVKRYSAHVGSQVLNVRNDSGAILRQMAPGQGFWYIGVETKTNFAGVALAQWYRLEDGNLAYGPGATPDNISA